MFRLQTTFEKIRDGTQTDDDITLLAKMSEDPLLVSHFFTGGALTPQALRSYLVHNLNGGNLQRKEAVFRILSNLCRSSANIAFVASCADSLDNSFESTFVLKAGDSSDTIVRHMLTILFRICERHIKISQVLKLTGGSAVGAVRALVGTIQHHCHNAELCLTAGRLLCELTHPVSFIHPSQGLDKPKLDTAAAEFTEMMKEICDPTLLSFLFQVLFETLAKWTVNLHQMARDVVAMTTVVMTLIRNMTQQSTASEQVVTLLTERQPLYRQASFPFLSSYLRHISRSQELVEPYFTGFLQSVEATTDTLALLTFQNAPFQQQLRDPRYDLFAKLLSCPQIPFHHHPPLLCSLLRLAVNANRLEGQGGQVDSKLLEQFHSTFKLIRPASVTAEILKQLSDGADSLPLDKDNVSFTALTNSLIDVISSTREDPLASKSALTPAMRQQRAKFPASGPHSPQKAPRNDKVSPLHIANAGHEPLTPKKQILSPPTIPTLPLASMVTPDKKTSQTISQASSRNQPDTPPDTPSSLARSFRDVLVSTPRSATAKRGRADVWTPYEHEPASLSKLNASVDEVGAPSEYLCGISRRIMRNPVITCDGEVYDRDYIVNHLKKTDNGDGVGTCPGSMAPQSIADLTADTNLQQEIREWRMKRLLKLH